MCNCGTDLERIKESAKKYADFYHKKIAIYISAGGSYNFADYNFATVNNYNIIDSYDPNEAI